MVKLEKGKILSSLIAIALLFGMNAKANATSKIELSYAKSQKNNDNSSEAASNEPIISKKIITKTQVNKSAPVKIEATKEIKKTLPQQNNLTKAPSKKSDFVTLAQMNSELGLEVNKSVGGNFVQKTNAPTGVAAWQKVGAPYQVNGIWYIPNIEDDFNETGNACAYKKEFQGRLTADGEVFDNNSVSVAHPTLPMPGMVEITNLENNNSIIARVNDRGPYTKNCMFGVSQKAANLLGFNSKAKVRVRYVGYAPPPANKPVQQFALNKLNPKINQKSDDAPTQFASNQDAQPVKAKNKAPISQNSIANITNNVTNIENVNFVKPAKNEKIDYNSILASL